MRLDDTQAHALARYLATLRPGQTRWTPPRILEALNEARDAICDDAGKLTQAALAATLDPKVVSPTVIPMTGRHWEGVSTTMSQTAPVGGMATRCRSCGGVHTPASPCQPRDEQVARLVPGELRTRYARIRGVA